MTTEPRPKRIVLLHPDGLMQILGVLDLGEDAPNFIDAGKGVHVKGKPVAITLVAAKRSHYLYKVV